MNREGLKKHEKLSHRKLLSTSKGRKQSMLRESHLLSEANVILYNASCSASVRLLPSFLLHVCQRCCLGYRVYCKTGKIIHPSVLDARAGISVSARRLQRTRTFAHFMMREENFINNPAHPLPLLVRSGLWGILQHLQETKEEIEMDENLTTEPNRKHYDYETKCLKLFN